MTITAPAFTHLSPAHYTPHLSNPHAGAHPLQDVLADPDRGRNRRALWLLLHSGHPRAVRLLNGSHGLPALLQARPEVTDAQRQEQYDDRRWNTTELLQDLTRALVNAPRTLAAAAAGDAYPVAARESEGLRQAVRRRLLVQGYQCDPVTVSRVTDASLAALLAALCR